MKTNMIIASAVLDLDGATELYHAAIGRLKTLLSKNIDEKYGESQVSLIVYQHGADSEKDTHLFTMETHHVCKSPEIIKSFINQQIKMLDYYPHFDLSISFTPTKYNSSSTVRFEFNPGEMAANLIDQKIEEDCPAGFEADVEKIIEYACLIIVRKAEEEMKTLKAWQAIIK